MLLAGMQGDRCLDDRDSSLINCYLPQYDDTLCFRFKASRQCTMDVELRSSTYEGIAMNASVPAGETETIGDMVPLETNGWVHDSSWYADSTSYVRVRRVFDGEGESAELEVRLLDYAARGEIAYYPEGSPDSIRKHIRPIPRCEGRFRSTADPDSDGLTLWEEYRGFCTIDLEEPHFRLDTSIVDAKRQVVLIDQDDMLEENGGSYYVSGFISRLCEMMRCSLVVQDWVYTGRTSGPCADLDWDAYELLDIFQSQWNADACDWTRAELSVPDPPYSHPAPGDPSNQVAFRLSRANGEIGEAGVCCHLPSNDLEWGYGICGTAGIVVDRGAIFAEIYSWWNEPDGWQCYGPQLDSTLTMCYRRTIAHELGHTLGIPDHGWQNGDQYQWIGNNLMCVMLNVFLRTELLGDPIFTTIGEWNDWYYDWRDVPSQENHKWGYYDDGQDLPCASSIHYRP